ncbi:MAG: hypothetical protein ACYDH1_16015 [Anaerolineaceae bacterium]
MMEIGTIAGMLFLWAVFLFRGLFQTKGSEERYVRVKVEPEQDRFWLKDRQ